MLFSTNVDSLLCNTLPHISEPSPKLRYALELENLNDCLASICTSDLHSFIHCVHFYSAPSNPLLLRAAPDYSTNTVSELHAEAHRQLQVKDLPKVPTWRLERERESQPRRHQVLCKERYFKLQLYCRPIVKKYLKLNN